MSIDEHSAQVKARGSRAPQRILRATRKPEDRARATDSFPSRAVLPEARRPALGSAPSPSKRGLRARW